jgi:Mannosyl-glycoprotein endo-beta-N-acetylglucosaminidase
MYFLRDVFASSVLALVLTGVSISAMAADADMGNDPDCKQRNWGPYDPKPGHPTALEREAFRDKLVPIAKNAEERFKVPAAAIAAMAMQESGYGFTRTALNANNLFGFKVPSSGPPGDRGKYTLVCQPAQDPGKDYIAFRDYEDAVMFVSERLSTLPRYAKFTAAYASIQADKRTEEDIVTWVYQVAKAGYNCCPDTYRRQISRMMNDPMSPSNTESERSLYSLSVKGKS